jgi:hypothetical protein
MSKLVKNLASLIILGFLTVLVIKIEFEESKPVEIYFRKYFKKGLNQTVS